MRTQVRITKDQILKRSIAENINPRNIQELIEQKKNRKPFYKGANSKKKYRK